MVKLGRLRHEKVHDPVPWILVSGQHAWERRTRPMRPLVLAKCSLLAKSKLDMVRRMSSSRVAHD